jgi:ATP-dependent Lon protease
MLEFCLENGNEMAIVPYSRNWDGEGNPPIESIFGWGHVIQSERLPDGRSNILLEGLGTAELIDYKSTEPFRIANVHKIEQDRLGKNNPLFTEMLEELLVLTKRILLAEGADESIIMKMNHITKHMYPIDFIASMLNYEYSSKQEILETTNIIEKSTKLLNIVRAMNMRE